MPEKKTIRPTSPHIQIYRWTLTMMLSILHRMTGVVLYLGTLLLLIWLMAVASGQVYYELVMMGVRSFVGQVILFAYIWALFHHMFGGIRHLIWDTGRGFDLRNVEFMARLAVLVPLFLTLLSWGVAYNFMGIFDV